MALKATVWAPDNGKVKMRAIPTKDCNQYYNIPTGAQLDVLELGDEWSKVSSGNHEGYMMTQYLAISEQHEEDADSVVVLRQRLEFIYNELGDILGLRG